MCAKKATKKPAKKATRKEPEPSYSNHLRGVLFKNDRDKRKGKKDPDMTGHVVLDRKELITLIKEDDSSEFKFWISGWHEKSNQGKYYMSLKLRLADPLPEEEEEEEEEEEDDDFPF